MIPVNDPLPLSKSSRRKRGGGVGRCKQWGWVCDGGEFYVVDVWPRMQYEGYARGEGAKLTFPNKV